MRHKIIMRTLLALTCCLALTGVGRAEDQDNNKGKKNKHEQTNQSAVTTGGHAQGNGVQGRKFQTLSNSSQIQSKQKLYTPNNFRAMHNDDLPADTSFKKGKFKTENELAGQSHLPAVQSNAQLQT